MIYPKIVRGGNAIPIGDNLFLMKGRKHKNGGIDIGKDLEVEGGEVMQTSPNEIKVFSAQKFLGGESPAELILSGANPDRIFAAQEQYKDAHGINDDGTKKKAKGGSVVNWIKSILGINSDNTKSPVKGNDNKSSTINFDNLKLTNGRSYNPQYLSEIYNGLIERGLDRNQAITIIGTIAEESGGDVFAKSDDKKYTGLLQWEDRRYKVQYPEDRNKELNTQLDYIADTLKNAQQRKDNGFNDDWTDGGEGSGYNSWKDAYKDFNDLTNVYNMTKGLNTGYVRPTGGIKGNTGSIINRMNAAKQIFENNGITDLKYEPDKKQYGGMSKKTKDTFMEYLMKSIRNLNQVRINNPAGIHLRETEDKNLRNELNEQYNTANALGMTFPMIGNGEALGAPYVAGPLLGELNTLGIYLQRNKKKDDNVPTTGKQKKACGGRKKALMGSDGKEYTDVTQMPTGVTPKLHDLDWSDPNAYKAPTYTLNPTLNPNEEDILAGQKKLKTDYWLTTGLGALGKTAAGVTGAIINNVTNRKYLGQMEGLINKMKAHQIPLTKLKTRYNINPQLAEIENALRIGKNDIDANTASSQVALARKRAATLNATLEKNKLHGQKENIETDLINKDRLQQAQTIAENIRNTQNVENQKLQMLADVVDKRAENASATTQNIVGSVVGGIDTILNGANTYAKMLAGMAKSPNGANAIYGRYGRQQRERRVKKKNNNKNAG